MWDARGWKAQLISISIYVIVYAIAHQASMIDGTFWVHLKISGMAGLSVVAVHTIIGGISAM